MGSSTFATSGSEVNGAQSATCRSGVVVWSAVASRSAAAQPMEWPMAPNSRSLDVLPLLSAIVTSISA